MKQNYLQIFRMLTRLSFKKFFKEGAMKKVFYPLAVLLVLAVFSSAFAGGNTGCGLGNVIFKGKSGKVVDVLAITTNGSSYSQFFAITSGTSGYQEGVEIGANGVELYVDENMDMLAADMSRGNGEYLDTLATLMEVEDKAEFGKKLQSNFDKIYSHENITSKEVVANINAVTRS